jgi:quinohemoprotein ethanol dehydrogenase
MKKLGTAWLLGLCLSSAGFTADKADLEQADPRNWPAVGRSANDTHYSPLTEINRTTISRLRLAWSLDLDVVSAQSTPLAVEGVVYVAAGYSIVYAVDGRSGKQLWRYDPEVTRFAGRKLRGGAGVRGLAYSKGRLYVGTHDGRLLALDAKKGTLVWGIESLRGNDGSFISGAPRVFGDKIAIGFGDTGTVRGAVDVYSIVDGKFLWRWEAEGGGGTVWNAITADPESGLIYVGTGNARGEAPNRSACSIIAINGMSGKFVWQYDESPEDKKACDSSTDITLATLNIDGQPRKVILHAPRDGSFHVVDRETGRAITSKKLGEGTHNHFAQSFHPQTGWMYLPTTDIPMPVTAETPAEAGKSFLLAWDVVKQRAQWAIPTPGAYSGGVLSTAGDLVFQGQSDGYLVAYSASEGRKAWAFFAGAPPLAAPISFAVGSKQYIAVLAAPPSGMSASLGAISARFGWDSRAHPRRLLAFALDGQGALPPTPAPSTPQPVDVPEFALNEGLVREGAIVYERCQWCHGIGAVAGGAAPDLRASPVPMNPPAFAAAVRGGLEARGMPKFEELKDSDLDALRHFLRARARAAMNAPAKP